MLEFQPRTLSGCQIYNTVTIIINTPNRHRVCVFPSPPPPPPYNKLLLLENGKISTRPSSRRKTFTCLSSSASAATDSSFSPPPPPPPPPPPAAPEPNQNDAQRKGSDLPTLARRFWKVAAPYWSSDDDKDKARLQLAAVFALTFATTGISVGFNFLGRDFYNALSNKDQEQFTKQLLYYLASFAGGIPVSTLLHSPLLGLCAERLCKRHPCFEMEILDDQLLHGTLSDEQDILPNTVSINN